MTESWENPTYHPENVSVGAGVEPANTFETLAIQSDGMAVEADDPQAIFSHVVEVTKAREAARRRKLEENQRAVAKENQETIGALVDLLGELDYPGAMLVLAVNGKPKGPHEEYDYDQLIQEAALWPIGTATDKRTGLPCWCFGPDKRLYSYQDIVYYFDNKNNLIRSKAYVPLDSEDPRHTTYAFDLRDALDAFDYPTEDDLLQ